jgi:hypothetical protein
VVGHLVFFLIKRKLKGNLVFLEILTAKIDKDE